MKAVIPTRRDQLDTQWFTAALADAFPGAEVSAAEPLEYIYGSAFKGRYALRYSGARPGPESVLVKAAFTEQVGDAEFQAHYIQTMRALNANEVRFYHDLGPTLKVSTAGCYFGAIDPHTGYSALLLEDSIASGSRFCRVEAPLSAAEVADGLRLLAGLHAATWGSPVRERLTDGFVRSGHLDMWLHHVNWAVQATRPRWAALPDELRHWNLVAGGIRAAWAAKLVEPTCVVHGDPHVDNWFRKPDGHLGLLDWQLVSQGTWAWDVSYFVASALTVEERRDCERDLVRGYLDALTGHGIAVPSEADAWAQLAKVVIWGLVVMLTPGNVQKEPFTVIRTERAARATLDWGGLETLGLR